MGFRMIEDVGVKAMSYKTFNDSDLKKHQENELLERMLGVAMLEVNLQECGINYAKVS